MWPAQEKGTVLSLDMPSARAAWAAYGRSWNPLGSNLTAARPPGSFFWGARRYEGLAFHKIVTIVGVSARFSSKIGNPLFNRSRSYLRAGFFSRGQPDLRGGMDDTHAFEGVWQRGVSNPLWVAAPSRPVARRRDLARPDHLRRRRLFPSPACMVG